MAYAEKTAVSVAKTKADIEELIQKAGAGQFVSGYKEDVAVIGFSLENQADSVFIATTRQAGSEILVYTRAAKKAEPKTGL